nr:reverse transcriptase domain-containing protein [Tanacetum cinerariifolium]
MWRKSFVKSKPKVYKNVGFLPVSISISKSRQAYNVMTNNINNFKEIVDNAWIKHSKDQFRTPTAQDIEILIQTCLMPLAIKTQNDSLNFFHELKKEMHADLKYVESLEKEIDELKSDKAEFSDMYDVILQECVSNDVKCSYLQSLSDLDTLDELQCMYLHKVKECDCLAQKLSKQTESVSKKVHAELLQRFAKVEKHSISLEIALQKCKEQQEMHADLKYIESLEKEIDKLKSDKAEFSDMYDVILQECVSKDVMCSYLMSLSDLDALDELQCMYLHKVKECNCLAQKLSKQTESVSRKVYIKLLQHFAKVEKHSISLELALQKCKEQKVYRNQSLHRLNLKQQRKLLRQFLVMEIWVQGNVMINRVYYVEGLNHNLFSVGQFCDTNLEVAFRKSTCFVRDLQSEGYRVYNKRTRMIVESIHIRFDEIKEVFETSVANNTLGLVSQQQKASDYDNPNPVPQRQDVSSSADAHVPSQQELDLLFDPLYDEFFNACSNTQDKQPSTNIPSTSTPSTHTNVHAEENNNEVTESSSHNLGNSNVPTFNQPQVSEYRWTKDQPLEQVSGNPSRTEYQLADMFTKALPEDRFKYLVRRIDGNPYRAIIKQALGRSYALSWKPYQGDSFNPPDQRNAFGTSYSAVTHFGGVTDWYQSQVLVMSSDNASSAVTYTSISSESDRPSWGIPLVNTGELPEIDPYEEVAQQGQEPPLSPTYVLDLMELDEHVPVYVPKPEHPEDHVPSYDDIQIEDQRYANDTSLIDESPGHIADSESMEEDSIDYPDKLEDDDEDPKEDPTKDHTEYPANGGDDDDEPSDDENDDDDTDDEDKEHTKDEDDDEKEEEHLALAESSAVPVMDPIPSVKDTKEFETNEARKTVRLEPPISASMEARIAEHAAAPMPPTSLAYDQAPLGYMTTMLCVRDDIPKEDMPPQRRFLLTALPPRIMPVTKQGANDAMTLKSIQAMIDRAIQRNSTYNQDDASQSHDVAYAMTWGTLKKKLTEKYYPKGEIKKLEIELWNLKVRGNDVAEYTQHFQELALRCTKFLVDETEKVDKYISGLPDNIHRNVMSARPKTLDD